jgi:NADPH:quinone reductase-like Zn-dependent oxidoreductase
VIPAASSSVGIAAIEIAKTEGAVSIATTRKSNKNAELLSLGANHVIATEEEGIVSRVREITGGKGARVIFDRLPGHSWKDLPRLPHRAGLSFSMVCFRCNRHPSHC